MDFIFNVVFGFVAYGFWKVRVSNVERSITVAVVPPPPDWLDGEVVNNRYWLPGEQEQLQLSQSLAAVHESSGVLRITRSGTAGLRAAQLLGKSVQQFIHEYNLGLYDELEAGRRGVGIFDDRVIACSQCKDAMVKEVGSRFVCHRCGLASYKTPKQVA